MTDEEADFLNSLYRLNIPTPTIAHMMQRMIAGQRVEDVQSEMFGTASGSSVVELGDTMVSESASPPPSYSES